MFLTYDPFSNPNRIFTRKMPMRTPGGQLVLMPQEFKVSFAELADADLLNTLELGYLFGCSSRTLYRWISERGLRPSIGVGRELYFTKTDVVNWFNSSNRPSGPGRPKRS